MAFILASESIILVIVAKAVRNSMACAVASCLIPRMFSLVSFRSSRTFSDVSLQKVTVVNTLPSSMLMIRTYIFNMKSIVTSMQRHHAHTHE